MSRRVWPGRVGRSSKKMYIGSEVGQSMAWHDRARLGFGWGGVVGVGILR